MGAQELKSAMKALSGQLVLLAALLAALIAASAAQPTAVIGEEFINIRDSVEEPPQYPDDKDPAHSQHEDVVKPLGYKKTCDESAEAIDVSIIARKQKWDPEATRQLLANQVLFGSLVKRIATHKNFTDAFAGSAMARNPGEEATIWIKGKLPEEAAAGLRTLLANAAEDLEGMKVQVVDGMRFSEAEQEERAARIVRHLEEKYELQGGVGAAVRPGDLLLITLPSPGGVRPSEPRETPCLGKGGDMVDAALFLDNSLLPKDLVQDPRGIMFEFTDGDQDTDLHARGGRQVYGGGYQCTSGFAVYRISDGLSGVTTAGHCTGMSTFDAEPPESDFALYHRAEHCGSHGDVEWKTTSHIEPAEYWASPSDRRDVRSVENWYSVNNWYCLYSRMTGTRTCDQVYSTSVSQSGCQGRKAYRLVAMDDNLGVGGDSGGPWSWGTMAAGVVKGYKTIWFSKRATFTKATRFDNALGVWIKTK